MRRALVVYCHPDPASLVAAARDRVLAALRTAGVEYRLTDLHQVGFEPCLTADEHRDHLVAGAHPSVAQHAADLQWCDTLILVYPTWWGGQPAMLKGWIDRVWACDVAWTLPAGSDRLRPALRNVRRIVAVTTHGSAKYVNALEGEGGKRTITRSLRVMCHPLARTTWIAMYGVDASTEPERSRFLDDVERRVTRLAR